MLLAVSVPALVLVLMDARLLAVVGPAATASVPVRAALVDEHAAFPGFPPAPASGVGQLLVVGPAAAAFGALLRADADAASSAIAPVRVVLVDGPAVALAAVVLLVPASGALLLVVELVLPVPLVVVAVPAHDALPVVEVGLAVGECAAMALLAVAFSSVVEAWVFIAGRLLVPAAGALVDEEPLAARAASRSPSSRPPCRRTRPCAGRARVWVNVERGPRRKTLDPFRVLLLPRDRQCR